MSVPMTMTNSTIQQKIQLIPLKMTSLLKSNNVRLTLKYQRKKLLLDFYIHDNFKSKSFQISLAAHALENSNHLLIELNGSQRSDDKPDVTYDLIPTAQKKVVFTVILALSQFLKRLYKRNGFLLIPQLKNGGASPFYKHSDKWYDLFISPFKQKKYFHHPYLEHIKDPFLSKKINLKTMRRDFHFVCISKKERLLIQRFQRQLLKFFNSQITLLSNFDTKGYQFFSYPYTTAKKDKWFIFEKAHTSSTQTIADESFNHLPFIFFINSTSVAKLYIDWYQNDIILIIDAEQTEEHHYKLDEFQWLDGLKQQLELILSDNYLVNQFHPDDSKLHLFLNELEKFISNYKQLPLKNFFYFLPEHKRALRSSFDDAYHFNYIFSKMTTCLKADKDSTQPIVSLKYFNYTIPKSFLKVDVIFLKFEFDNTNHYLILSSSNIQPPIDATFFLYSTKEEEVQLVLQRFLTL